jgi:hypothetical protein
MKPTTSRYQATLVSRSFAVNEADSALARNDSGWTRVVPPAGSGESLLMDPLVYDVGSAAPPWAASSESRVYAAS